MESTHHDDATAPRLDEPSQTWSSVSASPIRGRRAIVERVIGAGRARWPGLVFDEGALLALLDRQLDPDRDSIDPSHAADLFLAGLCLLGVERACAIFVTDYLRPLRRLADRIVTHDDASADLLQELAVRFLLPGPDGGRPWLWGYAGHGSLRVWLRLIIVRRARNLVRDRRHDPTCAPIAHTWTDDPELALVHPRHRDTVQLVFAEAVAATTPRDRRLLNLHYVHRATVSALASRFETSRSSVHRRLDAARAALLRRIHEGLAAKVRTTECERHQLIQHFDGELLEALHRLLAVS